MLVNEGVRQEILKRILDADEEHPLTAATDNGTFLGTKLLFRGDGDQEVCFDSDGNGVMMGWETGIMQESARLLCQDHPNAANGLTVVNIGHGLGIIDEALHAFRPTRHIIVEAHPDVLQRMREKGWYDWPGVEVYEGRWQDWLESEPGLFDAIYWDTFSEHYKDLHQFLDSLLNLLAEDGRFSFFHGLGADNRCFYDVYTWVALFRCLRMLTWRHRAVSEYHLRDCRLEVEWHDVPVKTKAITWEGVAYQYWKLSIDYRLPLCKAMTGP
jgi:protein arginine N-methyltransferase 2